MEGRESIRSNSIFFACSLIEYIGRTTYNRRAAIANSLGAKRIEKIIDLADVYHSDNIDAVSDQFICDAHITRGDFDNVSSARYAVPSHWDIGKVYKRLALNIADDEHVSDAEAILKAYNSPISALIDDYNGSFYYESPQAIFAAYKYGDIE